MNQICPSSKLHRFCTRMARGTSFCSAFFTEEMSSGLHDCCSSRFPPDLVEAIRLRATGKGKRIGFFLVLATGTSNKDQTFANCKMQELDLTWEKGTKRFCKNPRMVVTFRNASIVFVKELPYSSSSTACVVWGQSLFNYCSFVMDDCSSQDIRAKMPSSPLH